MKVAVAILVCVVIQQACGFSFPSFETFQEAGREIIEKGRKNVEEIQATMKEKLQPTETVKTMWKEIETNGPIEKFKEAGREIITKASKNVEEIQETVKEKLEPTETVKKMWKEIQEKVSNPKEEWKERKKQMKEMLKDLKKKAGESKDELVKMWKENKGTWRQQAEKKLEEAGKEIREKASKRFEEIQETVKEKLEPTETVTKMWREMKEKLNNQKEEWQERKKQMKETYKDLKKKAGEKKDELVKMWKENEGTWRQKAEQKWQSFKGMTSENLEQFKREIDSLLERLNVTAPEKPWKKIKEIRSEAKSVIIAMKEAFEVKLREFKEKAELGPGAEEELSEEESKIESEETEEPFTDEFAPTMSITTEPEELPITSDVFTDYFEPTEMESTPTTEYIEVLNDEQETGEEWEEKGSEDEVFPEEPMEGGIGKENEEEVPVPKINVLSRIMSSERKRHWSKRGKAIKNKLKKWFQKRWGDD